MSSLWQTSLCGQYLAAWMSSLHALVIVGLSAGAAEPALPLKTAPDTSHPCPGLGNSSPRPV